MKARYFYPQNSNTEVIGKIKLKFYLNFVQIDRANIQFKTQSIQQQTYNHFSSLESC